MKKRLIIIGILAVVLAIAALIVQKVISKDTSVKEPTTSGKMSQQGNDRGDEDPLTFGFSCVDMSDPYFIALEASLRSEVEENGARLSTKDAKRNQDTQNKEIEGFVSEKVDALFIAPVSEDGATEAVKTVKKAGIPVINLDSKLSLDDSADVFIGADCEMAGKLCANDLIRRVPDGGTILIIENDYSRSVTDAVSGFERSLASAGFEVRGRLDCHGSRGEANISVASFLDTHHNVTSIFCGSDQMALGAYDAVTAYNEGRDGKDQARPYIYGVGGSPNFKSILSDAGSLMTGTAATSPISIGQDGALSAFKILNGEKYDQEELTKPYLIDHENIVLYGIDGWQ